MSIDNSSTTRVYTTENCVQCGATKRWLDTRGIDYETVDLTESPDDYAAVTALGYKAAPVVAVGEHEHWGGFRVDLLELHFGKKAA